jgi:hypothetical protein
VRYGVDLRVKLSPGDHAVVPAQRRALGSAGGSGSVRGAAADEISDIANVLHGR